MSDIRSKKEYLNRLTYGIRFLPDAERREILSDYEEHFAQGMEAGKSESDICAALGDPEVIAEEYRAQKQDKRETKREPQQERAYTTQADSSPRADDGGSDLTGVVKVLVAVLMGIVQFCLVIIAIAVFVTLAALIIAAVAVGIAGIVLMCLVLLHPSLIFIGLGLMCLGILGVIGSILLIKLAAQGCAAFNRLRRSML